MTVKEKIMIEIEVTDETINYAKSELQNAIKCLKHCLENGTEYQIYQDAPYYADKIEKAGRQYEMLSCKRKMLCNLLKDADE